MQNILLFSLCFVLLFLCFPLNTSTNQQSFLLYYDDIWQNRTNINLIKEAANSLSYHLDREEDVEVLWRLSRFYFWLGEKATTSQAEKIDFFKKGKEYAEQAVNIMPDSANSQFWLASLTGKIGETQGILQSLFMVKPLRDGLEKVIALDDRYAAAYYGLAILYRLVPKWPLSIGNYNTSLEYAKMAVALEPESLEYLLGLAETYLALKNTEKAKEILENIISSNVSKKSMLEDTEAQIDAKRLLKKLNDGN